MAAAPAAGRQQHQISGPLLANTAAVKSALHARAPPSRALGSGRGSASDRPAAPQQQPSLRELVSVMYAELAKVR